MPIYSPLDNRVCVLSLTLFNFSSLFPTATYFKSLTLVVVYYLSLSCFESYQI